MAFTRSVLLEQEERFMTVALVGNPNSGKSTVFNALTRLRQKVGNYPGVTVEKKLGRAILPDGKAINVLDLPGTYSLAVQSPDERVVRDVLLGHMDDTSRPDVVVCIVDASNIERNLYLVSQVQDLGIPVVVALNMMDETVKQGRSIDPQKLQAVLRMPVVPMVASREQGLEDLKTILVQGVDPVPLREWRMPAVMEEEVALLAGWLCEHQKMDRFTAFSEAVIHLSTPIANHHLCEHGVPEIWTAMIQDARQRLMRAGIKWRSAVIEARYDWIHRILEGVVTDLPAPKIRKSDRFDAVLTHRVWGWVVFVSVMVLMFYMIFTIAAYPMEWISEGFKLLSNELKAVLPAGDIRDLLTDGIIAGVGGVVVFLPQILTLFFFISLMQDTGYMARAAFIMDRLMSQVGLHGKAFIPLLCGFACAIPSIMACRSIENPKDRLVTILVSPLMVCSARLPVFALMIAVLIPQTSPFEKAGIMLVLYLTGIIGAILMAWVFKRTIFKGPTPPFIMELPPYRWPSFKATLLHMWERSQLFLRKAGTVILLFSVIIWGFMTYPKLPEESPDIALRHSFAGRAGVLLEPVIKPLGYDWRIGIGLLGSLAAREIFVSTMSIAFNIDESEDTGSLQTAFAKARWPDGRLLFTPLACMSLLIFYVFAMQCFSTLVVTRRETNSWRWPVFQFVYMTGIAYIAALSVYQGGRWLGFQ
ncbi:MAG: ferrous iron transport protein B [Candidatus Omnitrophota bacterium]|jgi:ferrous iron transport protein B